MQLTTVPAAYDAEAYALYVKYQTRVHHDPPSKLTPDGYANFLCNSPIARSDASGVARVRGNAEGVCGSFHQHYRVDGRLIAVGVVDMCVHMYLPTPSTHWRIFLTLLSLNRSIFYLITSLSSILETFHMLRLPKCVSSVYMIYDPDLEFLSPGVLTALLEIEHTQTLARTVSAELKYYYMGSYDFFNGYFCFH